MHLSGIQEARVKAKVCYSVAIAAVAVQGGFASVLAQGAPDIVWMTNGHYAEIRGVAFTPDGATLASGSQSDGFDGHLNVWRTSDTALVKSFVFYQEDVFTLAFSPDGTYLAEGGGGGDADEGRIRMWHTSDWSLARSVGGGGFITAFAFSSDSDFYAVASQDGNYIGLVPLESGLIGGSTDDAPHSGPVNSIQFAPNAWTLASAGGDGVVKVWDYTNGFSDDTLLKAFSEHSGPVNALAYVGNSNQLASAGADGKIIVHRISDGLVIHTLFDSNPIEALAASPDGKILLSAGSGLKFWRVADGALLYNYDKEAQGVGAVAITADGMHFAYGRADGAVVYARMPVVVEEYRQDDNIVLHWTGGSGLYRIQRRNHPVRGEWHNFGPPTTATSFTNAITREPVFYRVVSLPNR